MTTNKHIQINKYIAKLGYASRRQADQLVKEGKVTVNGRPAKTGELLLGDETINIEGLTPRTAVYYAYYKPTGVVTVNAQNNEEEITDTTVFPQQVFPIGRLDKDSEGLIVMTNDGQITDNILTSNIEKEYRVTIDRSLTHNALVALKQGVNIKIPTNSGSTKWYTTTPARVRRIEKNTFDIILIEGKNRQIRRMVGAIGAKVIKLKRFRIGTITLDNLQPGEYKELKKEELPSS